MKMTIH